MNRLTSLLGASDGAFAAHLMRESRGRDTLVAVKLLNLDHVAIAVHDLDATIGGYRKRYNVEPLYRETVESQGVEEAMIPVGGSFVQLLRPLDPETPVGRFLSKQGEGLHHVAYAVVSIEAALAHLAEQGAKLIDTEPRIGGRGARIAFVHPADLGGTLVELVELSDE
jgi:methylmalonyl-CoA/ethylmalonyl-CoA epimerase